MPTDNAELKADNQVIIVGAGWSGLACAITLINAGYQITLLESAQNIGGRARTIENKNSKLVLDNGQHIMLGAYHITREIFSILQLDEADILERSPLELNMFSPEKCSYHLQTTQLPAPLHLVYALLKLTCLSFCERLKSIVFCLKLYSYKYKLKKDLSVKQLLTQHNQSEDLIKILWGPLCLATMNTPIQYASAQIFLNVLKDSFTKKTEDSNLLFFKKELSQVLCSPTIKYIKDHGSSIYCREKVTQIKVHHIIDKEHSYKFSIQTGNNNYQSQHLVLATPAYITDKLLKDSTAQIDLIPKQASLLYSYEPIYTIYIQYPEHIQLPHRMVGFFSLSQNIISQWAVDRSLNGQDGLIAIIISGPGKHTQLPSSQLVHIIHKELKYIINSLPDFLEYKIIREKRATFSCHVDIEQQRPKNNTSMTGLYLAGDYTDTGYPSTLEGAVKSGVLAAREIIQQNS